MLHCPGQQVRKYQEKSLAAQSLVRNSDSGLLRVDGTEREVLSRDSRVGDGVEEGGLSICFCFVFCRVLLQ